MQIPIRFPSDAAVIAEESARFRALSSAARIEVIRGLLEAGALMLRNSPRAAFLKEQATAQEDAWRRAVQEFVSRHADRT